MKLLVTGASGFVGSVLCHAARERGMDVRECRRSLPPEYSSECVLLDMLTVQDWSPALQSVDVVVHLAARVHQINDRAPHSEGAYRQMNVDASRRLIQQSAQAGVRRFVFVSSIKVNGECSYGRPFTENDLPAPIDPYGRSKLEAEQCLRELAEASGMDWVVIRPPLIYGEDVKGNFLRLLRGVHRGFPVPESDALRSYLSVWSLADLILLCCKHPAAANQLFLAEDVTLATTRLIRLLASAMRKPARLFPLPRALRQAFIPLPVVGPILMRLCGELQVSSAKARTLLGWVPVVPVDEALRRTVASYLKGCDR